MNNFEHVNLNEIKTGNEVLPVGDYNLRVISAELKDYVSKKDGEPGQFLKVGFAVTDDPSYSGRRVYQTFFSGSSTDKQFRILMDATGVEPDGVFDGPGRVAWLNSIRDAGITFSAPVKIVEEPFNGEMIPKAQVNMWKVSPAA